MKFVRYLEQWKKRERWRLASPERAANVFGALLRGELFEEALLGLRTPNEREINGLRSAENKKPGHFPSGL
jgi:hypothetical protein